MMSTITFGQQALWLHQTLNPDSTLYNLAFSLEADETLDPKALRKAFEALVAKYDVLRMRFPAPMGTPEMVETGGEPDFLSVDARHWSPSQLQQALRAAGDQPFDLSRDALMRVRLFERADGRHAFSLTFHHIAADLWSLTRFSIDLGRFYSGLSTDADCTRFATWPEEERHMLAGPRGDKLRAFWIERLRAMKESSTLPIMRSRPPARTFAADEVACDFCPVVTKALRRFAQQHGVTLYTVMLSAFFVLIHKCTGRSDVVIGTPFSGRAARHHRRTLGYFVNPLPLEATINPLQSFAAFLAQTKRDLAAMLVRQDYPFPKMVQDRGVPADQGRAPLYDIEFDYDHPHNLPDVAPLILGRAGPLPLNDLRISALAQPRTACERDLHLFLSEGKETLYGSVYFNKDLFDRDAIHALAQHYRHVLDQVIDNPDRPLNAVELLSAQQRQTVLRTWNNTRRPYATGFVHRLFEETVLTDPEAITVVADDITLTRLELNRRANRLAHLLTARGARVDTCVGITLPRSADLVVAILAVLKSGAAFVPISPSLPQERRTFIIGDIKAPLIIDEDTIAQASKSMFSEANPEPPLRDDALAYVIYTSGSTGQPKGAMNQHGALLNRLRWMQEYIPLTAREVVAQKTPATFDVSVWEFLWPLMVGARMALAREHGHGDPRYLAEFIRRTSVTIIHFVPSMLEHFLDEPDAPAESPLEHILCSGEALSAHAIRKVADRFPRATLHNLYGPTEAAIDVTAWTCCAGIVGPVVPIGRPIANVSIYILDPALNPVPVGVPGDLYIAGTGVGRGYWRRPSLTAERFLPDPWATCSGRRMYATGDIARYAAGGLIEYLGRSDFQVKINGQRIETEEIDALVMLQPHVARAVTVAVGGGRRGTRLVCFVKPEAGVEIDLAALHPALQEHLPETLIPAYFVALPEIPLNPNGKVDRNALYRVHLEEKRVEPVTQPQGRLEKVLAGIWREVLERDVVGREDEFFTLGGHSLLAVKVAARIRALLGCEVSLTTLFQRPTLVELAKLIDHASLHIPLPAPCRREQTRSPLLSPAQRQFWFLQALNPDDRSYIVTGALRLEGLVQEQALASALRQLSDRHAVLRTVFEDQGGTPVQRVLEIGTALELEVSDIVGGASLGAIVGETLAREVARSFDLAAAPCWRSRLLRLGPGQSILVLALHHIICDGWSLEILVRELSECYSAQVAGRSASLPGLPLSYVDYCLWQEDIAGAPEIARQVRFWQDHLADAPPRIELPTDWLRARHRVRRGGRYRLRLPVDFAAQTRATAEQLSITPFGLLLSALKLVLWRAANQCDLSIGIPVAGRRWTSLEPIVGLFVNTVIVRTQLSPAETGQAFMRGVADQAAQALSASDVPFGTLVEHLKVPRELGETPLFNVLFAYQSTPPLRPHFNGLTAEILRDGPPVPKMDLSVEWHDEDDALACAIEYDASLFLPETIETIAERYLAAVKHLCVRAGETLSTFSPDTVQTLVGGPVPQEPRETLPACLRSLARTTPDRVAVACGAEQVTFGALEAWSDRLAARLHQAGVRRGDGVLLLMPRGVEAIAGLFAILKAGAFYIPVEPSAPYERLQAIMSDSRSVAAITVERCKAFAGFATFDPALDRDAGEDLPAPELAQVEPQDAAYAIYTSGSTGTPKGVLVTHSAVMNLRSALVERVPAYHRDRQACFSLNAPLHFDASVQQLVALCDGKRLEVVPEAARQDPDLLVDLVAKRNLSVLDCTPSHLQALIEAGLLRHLTQEGLTLLVGGEAIPDELWRVLATTPRLQAYNVYGPTEGTVDVTAAPIFSGTVPNLGAPLGGIELLLLSEDLTPTPAGAVGEICIAGAGLALGYINRPALTAENFVPHPQCTSPGARLYRTGDLGRIRLDGTLRYLGRRDAQVKIRGYRVELGEVEAHLCAHPVILQAVVRPDGRNERLIAFVAPRPGEVADASAIRAWLAERIPDYMQPARIVSVPDLPRTSSGKIDRMRLREPEDTEIVAPATPIEQELAGIWEDLLGSAAIGRQDSFFERGGHSLLAARLAARIRARFGRHVQIREIFEHPTLESLATLLDSLPLVEASPPAVAISALEMLPSPAQERMLFLDKLSLRDTSYHVIGAVRLCGNFSVERLRAAIQHLSDRHPLLRASFPQGPNGPIIKINERARIEFETHGLKAPHEVSSFLRTQAGRPFDLAQDPLWRVALIELAPEDHVLAVNIHHIITDAWSIEIFVRELCTLLAATPDTWGQVLPALRQSYLEYVTAQRSWLKGHEAKQCAAYWRDRLADHAGMPDLVTDWRRSTGGPGPAGRLAIHFSTDEITPLATLARETGTTLYMVLAAAFSVLLARLTGEHDVIFGTAAAGRDENSEGVLGLFVNTLPMRVNVSENPAFRALLQRMRTGFLADLSHQDLPFEVILDKLKIPRHPNRHPLFQAMLLLQTAPQAHPRIAGLTIEPIDVPTTQAKLDLLADLRETDDGLRGYLEYDASLFNLARAERIAAQFLTIVQSASRSPSVTLARLTDDSAGLSSSRDSEIDSIVNSFQKELFS